MLVRQNIDNTVWVYALEVAAISGPTRIAVNYIRAPGDDPGTRETTEDMAASQDGLNSCYMRSWGYLMYYMYGAGDGWDAAGHGQPANLQHVGARLDYSVASNLDLSAVCSFAWRDTPNAYRLGGDYRLGIREWTNDDILASQNGTGVGRAVPDHARFIGWELDLGVDWKILENLLWSSTFAFWKPGDWWSYAYPNTAAIYRGIARPNSNPDNAAGEALATVGTGRSIDPLVAFETKLIVTF